MPISQSPKAQLGVKKFDNQVIDKSTAIRVKKGTKFKVRSLTKVSDYNSSGARMTFSTTELVTKRYVTFPVGTTFKAEIENSHQPQITGNGGLLKINADLPAKLKQKDCGSKARN